MSFNGTDFTPHWALDVAQALGILVSGVFSLVLFIMVGYLAYRATHFRIPFPLRLVIVDIVVIGMFRLVLVTPSMFVFAVSMKRGWACVFFGFMHDGWTTIRVLMSTVISIDRFLLTLVPGFYKHNPYGIGFSMLAALLVVYFVYLVVSSKYYGCFVYQLALKTCTAYGECELYSNIIFGVFLVSAIFLPAISFPIMYYRYMKFNLPDVVQSEERQAEEHQGTVEGNEELQEEQREQQLVEEEQIQRLREVLRQLQPQEDEHEDSEQQNQSMDEEAENEEPNDGAEIEEPVQVNSVEEVFESEIDSRRTNRVMMLLLLSVVLFHTMPFVFGFLKQHAILAPSLGLYVFQVFVSYPLTYVAPIFDCLVVLYHYGRIGERLLKWRRNRSCRTPALSFPSPLLPSRSPSPPSTPPPPTPPPLPVDSLQIPLPLLSPPPPPRPPSPPTACDEATPIPSEDPPTDQPRADSPTVLVEFNRRQSLPYMPILSPIKESASFKLKKRETEV